MICVINVEAERHTVNSALFQKLIYDRPVTWTISVDHTPDKQSSVVFLGTLNVANIIHRVSEVMPIEDRDLPAFPFFKGIGESAFLHNITIGVNIPEYRRVPSEHTSTVLRLFCFNLKRLSLNRYSQSMLVVQLQ